MFTKFISTCLLSRTFTNVHKCSQILFPHVSCPEHSQMFTNLISMSLTQNIHKCSQIIFLHVSCLEYLTNVHKFYFHMSHAQNIHKCSQSLFLHVSCPEHSQMFTNTISTCDFRIWTQILWKYIYFRVINVDFNPYCTLAHCMIIMTPTLLW